MTCLSVVIPTYNRGPKLGPTLDALLASDVRGLDEVEIVVVDDGSPTPAAPVVEQRRPQAPFSLRCIRQANAGPAEARNTGFRATHGDLVLFMDDDILPPPELLQQHVAAHRQRPGCVIFGSCPFATPTQPTPLFRYLDESPEYNPPRDMSLGFMPRSVVASGQLSVERSLFQAHGYVYLDGLATPAAEELELSYRLWKEGIPVLHAPWIVALHDHPVNLESMCRMQYKHAMGYAEVARKCPPALTLPELRRVLDANGPAPRAASWQRRMKGWVKRLAVIPPLAWCVRRFVEVLDRSALRVTHRRLYTAAISIYFWMGIRDGLKRYRDAHPITGASGTNGAGPDHSSGGAAVPPQVVKAS